MLYINFKALDLDPLNQKNSFSGKWESSPPVSTVLELDKIQLLKSYHLNSYFLLKIARLIASQFHIILPIYDTKSALWLIKYLKLILVFVQC